MIEEFVKCEIAAGAAALSAETNYVYEPLQDVDLDSLIHSDWVAYQFANAHWKFLHVPPNTPFKVRPRMDVTKVYYKDGEKATVNECIFKLSWEHVEPNTVGSWLPSQRRVTMGTTLVIDRDSPDQRVRVPLTSDRGQDQREHRDQLLHRMVDDGLLYIDEPATGPDWGRPAVAVRTGGIDRQKVG